MPGIADLSWPWLAALASAGAVLAWWPDRAGRLRRRAGPAAGEGRGRSRRLLPTIVVGVSALTLTGAVGWWVVPIALGLGGASYWMLGRLDSSAITRRRGLMAASLPQCCDLLAVCLDAGLPLRRAVEALADALDGPLAQTLGEVAAKVRLGTDEASAWAELAEAEPPLRGLGREVCRSIGHGLALADALTALGVEARRTSLSAAETAARKVGVRSVLPLMTCFLPAFMLLGVVPIIGGIVPKLFG